MDKKYPKLKGRVYTEKKVDKDGREYQEGVFWAYVPPQDESDGKEEVRND